MFASVCVYVKFLVRVIVKLVFSKENANIG